MTTRNGACACPPVLRRLVWAVAAGAAVLGAGGIAVGCSSIDMSGPTAVDATHIARRLVLSDRAITMSTVAPYDTLQLSAVVLDGTGHPLAGVPRPTFTTSDSSVRVDSTGLLRARATRSGVRVIATVTVGNARVADTAVVAVTDEANPPTFRQLRLRVPAGDSTRVAALSDLGFFYTPSMKSVVASALDSAGQVIGHAWVALSTSDSLLATIPPIINNATDTLATVQVLTTAPATIIVYATATVYGMRHTDSLRLSITSQLTGLFVAHKQAAGGVGLQPDTIVIAPGGSVWWRNATAGEFDVVFDQPSAALPDTVTRGFLPLDGGGDIAPYTVADSNNIVQWVRRRRFEQPGTYHFHSTSTGLAGVIVVR